jgi:predicted Rossmann fold flavoprotein
MDNRKVMAYFENIGLPLVEERGDRVFPASMRAQDVTDTLVSYLNRKGVKIVTGCEVDKIQKDEQSGLFSVYADGRKVTESPNVIIATGGLSYPVTGSTGDGYLFAKSFGHKIVDCFPSLTALTPANYSQQYHGISLKNVEVTLYVNNQEVVSEFGDLDFTNGGIEGPIGFKISRKGVQNLRNGQKVAVSLDLKPAVSIEQLTSRINREIAQLSVGQKNELQKNPAKGIALYLLPKLMPKALINPFVNSDCAKGKLTLQKLPLLLKGWRFEIKSYVGYERCVVTAGGVNLSEVSQKNMESKLVKGLFFAGEVLDLDGDTGGYNLQIAFSTAALAAESIKVDA